MQPSFQATVGHFMNHYQLVQKKSQQLVEFLRLFMSRLRINGKRAAPCDIACAQLPPHDGDCSGSEAAPFCILIIEDDQSLLKLYAFNLNNWSMRPQLILANDGREALFHLQHSNPDLIILDLKMPKMDGFKTLQNLSAHAAIVVVTGMEPAEIERRGGVPADIPVLRKPISFPQLKAIAETLALKSQTHASIS